MLMGPSPGDVAQSMYDYGTVLYIAAGVVALLVFPMLGILVWAVQKALTLVFSLAGKGTNGSKQKGLVEQIQETVAALEGAVNGIHEAQERLATKVACDEEETFTRRYTCDTRISKLEDDFTVAASKIDLLCETLLRNLQQQPTSPCCSSTAGGDSG